MKKLSTSLAGIYLIQCLPTGKVYVGKSRHVQNRWASHRRNLKAGDHRNRHLQAAWSKYGAEQFSFSIVEEIVGMNVTETEAFLCVAECRVLAAQSGETFNLMEVGQPSLKASDETRAILSLRRKAMWADPAFKEKMREKHRQKHADPEFKARHAAGVSRGKSQPEAKAKAASTMRKRWKDGQFNHMGDEQRELWKDPEYRARQTASRIEACADPETQELKAIGQREAWKDPEKRAKRIASLTVAARKASEGWNDPEIRKRRSAALRAGHAKKRVADVGLSPSMTDWLASED